MITVFRRLITAASLAAVAAIAAISATAPAAAAQHSHSHATEATTRSDTTSRARESHDHRNTMSHEMWMLPLGDGWTLGGMAQAIPTLTGSESRGPDVAPHAWELYLTQPAMMADVLSPGSRFALRVTLNFEGLTQRDGETSYGAWGEGFIDSRHPHTLLHEAMLSANVWRSAAGAFSLSAGKGFAPYGTDDPMSRPPIKYPTNHHLSQILERWTVNAQYLTRGGTSVEAGIFGGAEPTGPYDFSNVSSFGDSWSMRLGQRFGGGFGPSTPWEASASYADVKQDGHGGGERTKLANVALRHQRSYGFGNLYALAEASKSWPQGNDGYYSILGETSVGMGSGARHQPYYRFELATRPEYEREGVQGTDAFFRYHHDAPAIGATRWVVNTIGYAYRATDLPVSVRPYVELQHNDVRHERGPAGPHALYGASSFWSISFGMRLFFGGGEMRMGSYGLLDPMAAAMRPAAPSR
jgi:hypothetical protein